MDLIGKEDQFSKWRYVSVINYEEELKNFKPSLEVEDAESAIYNHDLTDVTDIINELIRDIRPGSQFQNEGHFMICYRCNNEADKHDFCPVCGADLHVHQKVLRLSNMYYNDGLQKAEVRNLSGAIISLKKSLKFNKYNIDARNLLGLVYYEMGETVDALSEWVISKSYKQDDNIAGRYLDELRQNRAQLEEINQTIKKYNQALLYCKQDSKDLAIIQLKKVLSLNIR